LKTIPPILVACLCIICLTGCKPKDEEILGDDTPKIAFEGAPDAKYAGTWKTEDGISVYELESSGGYKQASHVPIPKGKPVDSHQTGNWAVKGDRMLFKDQAGNVAAYSYALAGDKLTLTTLGSMKAKTVMDRKH